MSDYENDNFEEDQVPALHLLRLSIDLNSVKDFKVSGNLVMQYSFKLKA